MFHGVFLVLCWSSGGNITSEIENTRSRAFSSYDFLGLDETIGTKLKDSSSTRKTPLTSEYKSTFRDHPVSHIQSSYDLKGKIGSSFTVGHYCDHFAYPPPLADRRRTGPRRKFCFIFQSDNVFNSQLTKLYLFWICAIASDINIELSTYWVVVILEFWWSGFYSFSFSMSCVLYACGESYR